LIGQALRFLAVGVSNTALTLAAYALLVAAGAPPVAASAAAFAAGAVNGYRLNRAWTFRVGRRGRGAAVRYLAVAALGLALNALAVAIAVHGLGLPKLAGEVVALPPVTAATFLLSRAWVFRAEGEGRSRGLAVPRPR
jgi:putative flippase GtrA